MRLPWRKAAMPAKSPVCSICGGAWGAVEAKCPLCDEPFCLTCLLRHQRIGCYPWEAAKKWGL